MTRRSDIMHRPAPVKIELDGEPVEAYPGESLTAVLAAVRHSQSRIDDAGKPRGFWCNMGTCSECFVWLMDDEAGGGRARSVRACLLDVVAGMRVHTGRAQPDA
ncbi:(2Fe-2S)-binding protein [Altericroceibacterium endophyticum]|uniref:(2Fe-2S)-binding protein n=1 Tax=Altericroceibacterium endophyticum TaxID=1808508 RepID=A0A6I4T8D0_9SPHN|nr:(2Fe-2S)-binding protein [Altericroceibacterium endophyticum]MXO67037.1 (2Fe-2S)-binding protein [Altericroceibacterium endophyticum]